MVENSDFIHRFYIRPAKKFTVYTDTVDTVNLPYMKPYTVDTVNSKLPYMKPYTVDTVDTVAVYGPSLQQV